MYFCLENCHFSLIALQNAKTLKLTKTLESNKAKGLNNVNYGVQIYTFWHSSTLTRGTIGMRVMEQGGPIKSTLQNLSSCLLCTKVASTSMIVAKRDDVSLVMVRDTSPNDLIRTIFKKVRIVPKKLFHHGYKLGLILSSPM
jgi:hypothetical protein